MIKDQSTGSTCRSVTGNNRSSQHFMVITGRLIERTHCRGQQIPTRFLDYDKSQSGPWQNVLVGIVVNVLLVGMQMLSPGSIQSSWWQIHIGGYRNEKHV
ncbi:hypothetical protein HNY73_017480 [Argiope bruennichi]|uniref:Uncharacterized protein n=1 Tax=Argiope bruennichi TaxID=94029 RepID=A0A8T0E9T4_ARGBR|nr:hypothetical protein HNY73_017480 [Argiope bruennichi]